MNIKQLKGKTYNQVFLSTPLTYLVFGGQGSVYVSKLEYCPAKKQLKLLSEHKDTFKGPARFQDLLIYPGDTEILIEGYPGDDNESSEWVTPNELEISTEGIDFIHEDPEEDPEEEHYDENQKQLRHNAMEELYVIKENLQNQNWPDEEIKKLFQQFIQEGI